VNCTSSLVRADPGIGSSSTAFTQLKIVELAPMPSDSINTAIAAKPGLAMSERIE
jgi:hypothetical protein